VGWRLYMMLTSLLCVVRAHENGRRCQGRRGEREPTDSFVLHYAIMPCCLSWTRPYAIARLLDTDGKVAHGAKTPEYASASGRSSRSFFRWLTTLINRTAQGFLDVAISITGRQNGGLSLP